MDIETGESFIPAPNSRFATSSSKHFQSHMTQSIQSRHGHLSNAAASMVIGELLPGKIERVVLGHLSRDCNTPELALGTVRLLLEKCEKADMEVHCATQFEVSPRFCVGETRPGPFQPTFDGIFFQGANRSI